MIKTASVDAITLAQRLGRRPEEFSDEADRIIENNIVGFLSPYVKSRNVTTHEMEADAHGALDGFYQYILRLPATEEPTIIKDSPYPSEFVPKGHGVQEMGQKQVLIKVLPMGERSRINRLHGKLKDPKMVQLGISEAKQMGVNSFDIIYKKYIYGGDRLAIQQFIDSLIKLANELDERGFYKQADVIDGILRMGV